MFSKMSKALNSNKKIHYQKITYHRNYKKHTKKIKSLNIV